MIYRFDLALQSLTTDIFTTFNEKKFFEVNPITGELTENTAYDTTDYLEVTAPKYYFAYINAVAFYDDAKNFISGQYNEGGRYAYNVINTPENAKYVRVSGQWRENNVAASVCATKGVKPLYKDDANITADIETNQRFYRRKLSGKLTFIRDDYDTIIKALFDTTYILMIWLSENNGQTWQPLYKGKFSRTDCRVNVDDKIIEVTPETDDEYTAVLAGMDREYNLIELSPAINPVVLHKRPLLQAYIPGDNVISCFLSGMYWEQDATATSDEKTLVETYHFELNTIQKIIEISESNEGANGKYYGTLIRENDVYTGRLFSEENKDFYIQINANMVNNLPRGFVYVYIKRTSDNNIVYRYERETLGVFNNETFSLHSSTSFEQCRADMVSYNIYSRYILDVKEFEDYPTYPLLNDIAGNNRNYSRAVGFRDNGVIMSRRATKTPTEWGRRDDGRYFAPPSTAHGEKYFPVARSFWTNVSFWYRYSRLDWKREAKGRKDYELRDAFPIWSVIQVLLKKIAPGIKHEGTPEYSQFLYDKENPLSGDAFKLYISPKSNIIAGEYQTPAQKSPVTLQQITEMLRNVYKCYWYIENGKFKIEHVEYFRNGGSYSPLNPVIGYDLTELENVRNGRKWAFGTNAYTFDKSEMAERYEYEWMDDVTELFAGRPILVKSKFVSADKVEKINVGNFTSDIDIMILSPGEMSTDGFALLATSDADIIATPYTHGSLIVSGQDEYTTPEIQIKSGYDNIQAEFVSIPRGGGDGTITFKLEGGTYYDTGVTIVGDGRLQRIPITIPANAVSMVVDAFGDLEIDVRGVLVPGVRELPFVRQNVDGVEHVLQNGYLAFANLQPKYLMSDVPAYQLEVNGVPTRAKSIERKKKQEVRFPASLMINPTEIVKTSIGLGQIEKISVNLLSKQAKATLRYDTTEQ